MQRERRTDTVELAANPTYWNRTRGPRLSKIVFRNDLSAGRALDLVCDTEGQVDLVTEVPPSQAHRVRDSEHAELVAVDAFRVLAGAFDRSSTALPLGDLRARQALNLAIDRTALVAGAMHGCARPMSGLTPSVPLTGAVLFPDRLTPYPHNPERAAQLWRAATGATGGTLRLAALAPWASVAQQVAEQLATALELTCQIDVLDAEQEREARRRLAAKDAPRAGTCCCWTTAPSRRTPRRSSCTVRSSDAPASSAAARSYHASRSCSGSWCVRPARPGRLSQRTGSTGS